MHYVLTEKSPKPEELRHNSDLWKHYYQHIQTLNTLGYLTHVCMTVGVTSLLWTVITGYLHLNNKVTQTISSFDVLKV